MAIRDQERACSDPLALAPSQSPPYSSGSYDSIKTEVSGCPEDLTVGRAPTADDDDDDHDDHEDNDKMNDSEGMDPERLKAFNVSASESQAGLGGGSYGQGQPSPRPVSPADVCAALCGRELGPHGAHLQAAQGEDPGHH